LEKSQITAFENELVSKMISMIVEVDQIASTLTQTMEPLLIVAGILYCRNNNIRLDEDLLEVYKREQNESAMGFIFEDLVILNIFLKMWSVPFQPEISLFDFVTQLIPANELSKVAVQLKNIFLGSPSLKFLVEATLNEKEFYNIGKQNVIIRPKNVVRPDFIFNHGIGSIKHSLNEDNYINASNSRQSKTSVDPNMCYWHYESSDKNKTDIKPPKADSTDAKKTSKKIAKFFSKMKPLIKIRIEIPTTAPSEIPKSHFEKEKKGVYCLYINQNNVDKLIPGFMDIHDRKRTIKFPEQNETKN